MKNVVILFFYKFLALLLLIFLLPLLIPVAILHKLIFKGPLFYSGERIGKDERIFKIYKFRTLPINFERTVGPRLLSPEERHYNIFSHFLVRTKIDELPQLINVLKGDMSFVGPRPLRPLLYEKYKNINGLKKRNKILPGITGLAQLMGGYYIKAEDKIKFDLIYLENKTFLLDIKLILLTFLALIFTRNIMRARWVKKFLGIQFPDQ